MASLGIGADAETKPAAQLAELQHGGTYLARLVECPVAPGASLEGLVKKLGPTLLKRVSLSYKPKRIALLDPLPPGLADLFRSSPFATQLVANGEGIRIPSAGDAAAVQRVRALLAGS
jgi:hypothetical protein